MLSMGFARRRPRRFIGSSTVVLTDSGTNLWQNQDDFTGTGWFTDFLTVSANATTAPDGTLTADKLQETSGTAAHLIAHYFTKTTSFLDYTVSFYVKAAERTNGRMDVSDGAGNGWIWNFNLSASTATSGGGFGVGFTNLGVELKNVTGAPGWFRFDASYSTNAGTTIGGFILPQNVPNVENYLGTSGVGLYTWRGRAIQLLTEPPDPPGPPGVTIAAGDDWGLPSWVSASNTYAANSGYIHTSSANASLYGQIWSDVKLRWNQFESSSGAYNWSAIQNAINNAATTKVIVRLFTSDVDHLPTWLKTKLGYTAIRYRWGSTPYTDITDGDGSRAGDFYPYWRPEYETEFRRAMVNLGSTGLGANAKVVGCYAPGAHQWDEFGVKYIPEIRASGMNATQYLAWFKRHMADYVTGFGSPAKVIYTGVGASEFIEYQNDAQFSEWHSTINPNSFGTGRGYSALAQFCRVNGYSTRDGFTEVFNGYSDPGEWGQLLDSTSGVRYSKYDDTNAFRLAGSNGRYFGTESEDFCTSYFNMKMNTLNRLRLGANYDFAFEGTRPAGIDNTLNWARSEMGKIASNAPDAWCYLREYSRSVNNLFFSTSTGETTESVRNIRNFERWLTQREVTPGGVTTGTNLTAYDGALAASNGVDGYEALTTNPGTGNNYIYFYLDNTFHTGVGGAVSLDFKVTYQDVGTATWRIEYRNQAGAIGTTVGVLNTNDSAWKTATFRINDGLFNQTVLPGNADFRIYDGGTALAVQFVRVIKVNQP